MNKSGKYLVWTALSVLGAFALGYIALNRGEQINALWWKRRRALLLMVARSDKRNATRLYSEKFNFFKRRTQGVWR